MPRIGLQIIKKIYVVNHIKGTTNLLFPIVSCGGFSVVNRGLDHGSLDTNLQIKIVTSNIEYYALHMVFFVAAAEEERCRCSFDFHMSSARKLALNKTTATNDEDGGCYIATSPGL